MKTRDQPEPGSSFPRSLWAMGGEMKDPGNEVDAVAPPKRSAPNLPEVDLKKLVTKDRSIGYKRADGFLEMTNFKFEISGYVADGTV